MYNTSLDNLENSVNQQSAVPSGISHAFDTGYAIEYGVDEAIVIRNLQFFITANANRGHNFHEGRFWTYDRLDDFVAHFPYWSVDSIRRILKSLIKQKVIIKSEFNKAWSVRTQWYAFVDQEKFIPNVKVPQTPAPQLHIDLVKPPSREKIFENPDLVKSPNGRWGFHQMADGETTNCILDTSTITSTVSSSTSLKVPMEPTPACAGSDAERRDPKPKKIYSEKVKSIAQKFIAILTKNDDTYRPPRDLNPIWRAVHQLVEEDSQDPEKLFKLLEYAAQDRQERGGFKGWSTMIYSKKGLSEKFRSSLSTINASMRSAPKRDFSPCSDMDATRAAWKKAFDEAL